MNKTTALWLNAAAGVLWIGVGGRDLFAPNLFRFDGRVATGGTVILDLATGAIFLFVAFCFHQARSGNVQGKS